MVATSRLLNEPTVAARHFAEVGLSARQLHLWCEATGFEPADREVGRWRLFSPADVLRLAALRSLKGRTNVALSDQEDLLRFLARKDFATGALDMWASGRAPTLVTDLEQFHDVQPAQEVDLGWMTKRGAPLACALSLDGPTRLMLAAMVRGGSDDQKRQAVEVAVRAKVDGERRAKGKRALAVYPDGDADAALRFLLLGLTL